MRVGRIGTVAVLVMMTIVLTGCSGVIDQFRSTKTIKDEKVINKTVIAFVNEPQVDNYNLLRVPGWIDNQSGKQLRSATLLIQLSDGDGNKREKITYEVLDLAPKSRKTFDINAGVIPPDRKATVEVTQIEVFE